MELIKIDCNFNINLNLFPKINKNPNYNPIYSPIPKLKIKEKEVDMSLAGINYPGGIVDNPIYKEYRKELKENKKEGKYQLYTSPGTIKYTDNEELINYFIKNDRSYNKGWRVILSRVFDNFKNLILIDKTTNIHSDNIKVFLVNSQEEGEKLIKYLKQENILKIINNIKQVIGLPKSTLSHIPLPLFLVPPDHQDQHFNNYFKVTENTTLDYNNPDTYTINLEKIKKIKKEVNYSPTYSRTNIIKMELIENIKKQIIEESKETNEKIRKYGEVFTPFSLIEKMVDKLIINDKETYFDPCSGKGQFQIILIERILEWRINNGDKRDIINIYKDIIENQIYMCELQQTSIDFIKKTFNPNNNIKLNLWEGNFFDLPENYFN